MKEMILLMGSNLRRAKGQTISIGVLVLFASVMLNLWLMLSTDYKQNFEREHDRLHAGHVTLAVDDGSGGMREFLTEINEKDSRMEELSLTPAMHMAGLFSHNGGEISSEFVILAKEQAVSRRVGRAEIVEEGRSASGVYMPVLYKSKDVEIGKQVEISIGSRRMTYTVCGFFNSVMAGSHNCNMCEVILTEDKYQELKESGAAPEAALCSVRLKDKSESEDYETMLKNAVSGSYPAVRMVSNSYALVSQSRYISQMVCSGLLSAMAFFVLLIAVVVIASDIIHYIGENMKNLGALKAIGYRSRQLTGALLLQFAGISVVIAAVGAGLSYVFFPSLNQMMISQTGIPYQIRFLPLPFFASIGILGGSVLLAVLASSGRMKKIEPVAAFRQGMETHNFRRNRIALAETKLSLTFALALKTALLNLKHNFIVCITMLGLSLFVVFSGLMIENVIADIEPFRKLIIGETADTCINVNSAIEAEFLEEMKKNDQVEKAYLYTSAEVRHVGGIGLMATVCDDFAKVNHQEGVFEGRFPKYDNEIAVAAKYAGEKNLKLGDEIAVTSDGKEAKYLISGFTQTSNNLGKDCLLTRGGYERLGELMDASYYCNLTDGTNIDAFNLEVQKRYGSEVNKVINVDALVTGGASVYVELMKAIVTAVLVLSGIIIAFVLYLLVRTTLDSKRKDYGILKALGFTTGQLVLQTALFFMPAVVVSTVIGIVLCSFIINPLTGLFLRGIGIVKCTFTVPVWFVMAGGAGLIVFAFAAACLMSLRIRKIAPKELLI